MTNQEFNYRYSSKEQKEINDLNRKYGANINELKQQKNKASNHTLIISLSFGIIGTITLGLGLSIAMTQPAQYMFHTLSLVS